MPRRLFVHCLFAAVCPLKTLCSSLAILGATSSQQRERSLIFPTATSKPWLVGRLALVCHPFTTLARASLNFDRKQKLEMLCKRGGRWSILVVCPCPCLRPPRARNGHAAKARPRNMQRLSCCSRARLARMGGERESTPCVGNGNAAPLPTPMPMPSSSPLRLLPLSPSSFVGRANKRALNLKPRQPGQTTERRGKELRVNVP